VGTARLRGAPAGVATAITAAFGHGAAVGHLPTSQDVALFAVACLGLGRIAGSNTAFVRPARLFATLTVGLGVCHVLLTAATPDHPMSASPVMCAAHAVALMGPRR
jgi:hypothetical protein